MYGSADLADYVFTLLDVPVDLIDLAPHTVSYYEQLDVDVDGPRRLQIVREHIITLTAGQPLRPLVLSPADRPGRLWVRGGFHRLAAARTVGQDRVPAYVLIDLD